MPAVSIDAFVVPSAGEEGQTIAMSAQASTDVNGASLTYDWKFGDGTEQSGVDLTDVSHAYASPATPGTPYVVTLTVSDGSDSPQTDTADTTITDVAPTVSAGPSQTVYAGGGVQLNGTATDPGGSSDITSIEWDPNYDGTTFVADPSDTGNLTPTASYATPGTYVVALEATDKSGNTSEDFTTITVKPTDALLVNAGSDLTLTPGQRANLTGSYTDPGGTVSPSGIAWDTNYDGNTFQANVTGTLTPSVSFAAPGTYEVALQVTDNTHLDDAPTSDISIFNVTVLPFVGPTASAGSDQTINEGGTASFSGSYTDPDGTVSAANIAWDFNYDGATFTPQTTGTLTPTYQYTAPGTYQVALQITDSNGVTSLSTLNVTVSAVAPTVSAGSNKTVTAGQLVSFSGSASDPGGSGDPLSYAWDFNYNGSTFNPGSADSLTPYHVFTAPGTYVVALQATDSAGVTSISTINVTVNASNSLVVNAGPDQALNDGDTTVFAGSYTDGSGTVNVSTAQWDFNYNGSSFVADPSANGTLTPSHQFTTPGTYLVALQLTDSNHVTSLGTMYVTVAAVAPTVDAGADQTVNQGTAVQFGGSATLPSGAVDPLSYAWDFDYDGENFNADTTGTLTPTNTYTTPGTYEVALQVTDSYGQVSLATMSVTVNDVAPTATVTNSGPITAGSSATFTVSNLVDQTPGDTPTYLVDWTGDGTYEELTSDDITQNQNGSISFSHLYDAPSGPGGYNAIVQIVDGSGGSTNYTSNVVVNDATPTITFKPNTYGVQANTLDSTVPILFTVSDPSVTQTENGFTYYVSLDGGAYTSSSSPIYSLPGGIGTGPHTVKGYVVDTLGQQSAVATYSFNAQSAFVRFNNTGTGQVQLTWTGGQVTLSPGGSYQISGTAPNLAVALLTNGAHYGLQTNGSIASISAASGVSNVSLTVDTGINYTNYPGWVGNGMVGNVTLPTGSSVSIAARGDLGSLAGPSSNGTIANGIDAADLIFANLDGSITGVNYATEIMASGWLGTNASQQVDIAAGVGVLSAYGIGATVHTDLRQDAGDLVTSATIGDGGITGSLDEGASSGTTVGGDVNVLEIGTLEGQVQTSNVAKTETIVVDKTMAGPQSAARLMKLGKVEGSIIFGENSPQSIQYINAKGKINAIEIKNKLTLTGKSGKLDGDIIASSLNTLTGAGSLIAHNILANGGIGKIDLQKDLLLVLSQSKNQDGQVSVDAGHLNATKSDIQSIQVGGNLTALVQAGNSKGTTVTVLNGNFIGNVVALKGSTGVIDVPKGDFTLPDLGNVFNLVNAATGTVGDISVSGNIGGKVSEPVFGRIVGNSIGTITSANKSILLQTIRTTAGSINSVRASNGVLQAAVEANKGDVFTVVAKKVAANISAKVDPGNPLIGGSIYVVSSNDPIPDNVKIEADLNIRRIQVRNPGTTTEKFHVTLAQGFEDVGGGKITLVIDVGTGKFLGSVEFVIPKALEKNPPTYQNGNVMFDLEANNKNTTWTVVGPVGATSTIQAVFAELNDASFGLVKSSLKKAAGFTVNGPSGEKAK